MGIRRELRRPGAVEQFFDVEPAGALRRRSAKRYLLRGDLRHRNAHGLAELHAQRFPPVAKRNKARGRSPEPHGGITRTLSSASLDIRVPRPRLRAQRTRAASSVAAHSPYAASVRCDAACSKRWDPARSMRLRLTFVRSYQLQFRSFLLRDACPT